ncbi:trypsin-like peptidase domain-containing protein [Microbacteriaceae bacterium VKM Ac-2854]|nr:trypsin-like peptidase domain-containing protein [Microbacteriaceae bacterium VKM Ac-2854]
MDEQHNPDGASEGFEPGADDPSQREAAKKDDRRRRRRALIAGGAGLAVLIGIAAGATSYATAQETPTTSSSTVQGETIVQLPNGSAFGRGGISTYGGYSQQQQQTQQQTQQSSTTDAVAASDAQKVGVVTIVSTLGYESAASAGTGMILTSDGMILTNNHVVEGATSIEVTVESTGETYTATVVGTDATNDVAVLQLQDASGLTPVSFDTSGVTAGDAITAVGNAEGTGDLVAASGTVTATDQSITTQAEGSAASESLTGLIQLDADIVSGDSGGPLFNASGQVVGINTAASSGSADITGFAIPIATALDIVAQIEAGADTATIEIGYPAFLGIGLSSATGAATIAGVYENTPAAEAGLAAGDTITSVNGTAITTGSALSELLGSMEPGEQVTLTWTTAAGTTASATVTLAAGPAA